MNYRLKNGEQFRTITRRGKRVGESRLITHALLYSGTDVPEKEFAKVGVVASKVVGNAVKRNLVKRRLMGIYHELPVSLKKDKQIVFRAGKNISDLSYKQLKDLVEDQLLKIGA